jgi:hypothetical protein
MSSVNTLWLAWAVGGFVLGYTVARLDALYYLWRSAHSGGVLTTESRVQQPTSFFTKAKQPDTANPKAALGAIDIDARTVVTKIDTGAMQRGSAVELGKTTAQEDTISASVSKLANLKGK